MRINSSVMTCRKKRAHDLIHSFRKTYAGVDAWMNRIIESCKEHACVQVRDNACLTKTEYMCVYIRTRIHKIYMHRYTHTYMDAYVNA